MAQDDGRAGAAPRRVACLYVPEDRPFAEEFFRHLKALRRSGDISLWHPGEVTPGERMDEQVRHAIESSEIILVLLSPAFLSSDEAAEWTELALRQQRRSDARLLPVLLRPAFVEATPWASLQLLPRDGKAVTSWVDPEEAIFSIASELYRVLSFATIREPNATLPSSEARPSQSRSASLATAPVPPAPAERYPLDRIFGVRGIPELTYVEPDQMEELRRVLLDGCESLVIEGPSGIGKTTALEKALAAVGRTPVARILGSDPTCAPQLALDAVLQSGFLKDGGLLVIDDFHLLDKATQDRAARLIKHIADRGPQSAQVILVGVNLVSDTLLRDVPDLSGRYAKVSLRRQRDQTIARMIEAGEHAANIAFAQRDRLIELSCGSFFIAQLLCRQACRDEKLHETAPTYRVLEGSPDGPTLDRVVQDLSGRFRDLLVTFATTDDQSPPRGAGIALLWLLSRNPESCVTLEAARGAYGVYPGVAAALSWMAQSNLSRRFDDFPRLRDLLSYNRDRQALVAEDPRLTFFLRSMPWEAFLRDTRHRKEQVRWDPVDGPLFAPFAGPVEPPPRVTRPPSAMRILHLSDLHFQDSRQASLWFDQLADDLRQNLHVDPERQTLDLVVLSGDITDRGQASGYRAARQFLADLQSEFHLAPEQLILVPGNHDLDRKATRAPVDHRFDDFAEFYRSIRPEPYPQQLDQQFTLHHYPACRLLVLGLNSAWDLDVDNPGRASINGVALGFALRQIRNTRAYDGTLRLAVWHHPIQSVSDDRIRDTGFLERLATAGFRLGLHGHIHEAQPGQFRYDLTLAGRRVDLIGAGTFGAAGPDRPPGVPLQYQLIDLDGGRLRVRTRCRDRDSGAWRADARWPMGGDRVEASYEIAL